MTGLSISVQQMVRSSQKKEVFVLGGSKNAGWRSCDIDPSQSLRDIKIASWIKTQLEPEMFKMSHTQ